MEKQCRTCGESKPYSEYHKHQGMKDGRRSDCKACRGEYFAKRNARPEIKARNAENGSKWYAENREHVRARSAKWHAENRDAVLARQAEYWRSAEGKKRYAEYCAAHPHIKWESSYRQRAKRFGFAPVVENFTRDELMARWGPDCWHCGGTFEELDHWPLPISRGGAHSLDNCVPSSRDCNQRSWRTESV